MVFLQTVLERQKLSGASESPESFLLISFEITPVWTNALLEFPITWACWLYALNSNPNHPPTNPINLTFHPGYSA